jgi:HTH-type transcriptional regulator/antitoxin HigA
VTLNPENFPTAGRFIRALLQERGWDQRTLARVLGLGYGALSRLINDKKPIDAFAALMLADVFEVDAEVFLALQRKYDLAVARASAVPDPGRSIRAALYGSLPIPEMIYRGWLGDTNFDNPKELEAALTAFFGVESVERIPVLPHAARKTEQNADITPAQLAWLYRVRSVAASLQVPRYTPQAVREAVEKLKPLLVSTEGVAKVQPILAEAGIRFVIVEALSTTRIDGVCTWLNDMAPVIGMTLRHDRIDNFWFVLRHEIEHVLNGHGRKQPRVDVELDNAEEIGTSEEERIANAAAADFCVPKDAMENFYKKKQPFFMKQDVLGFAAAQQRHPGLVVGQLQYRGGRFDRFREYLHKVRDHVIRAGTVDGWNYVFPVADSARTA